MKGLSGARRKRWFRYVQRRSGDGVFGRAFGIVEKLKLEDQG